MKLNYILFLVLILALAMTVYSRPTIKIYVSPVLRSENSIEKRGFKDFVCYVFSIC